MRTLQVILIGFALMGIASLVSGIQAFTASVTPDGGGTQIFYYESIQGRIFTAIVTITCLLGVYGIHKRSIYVWWVAWAAVTQAVVTVLWDALPATLNLPANDKWIATSAVLLGVGLIGGYWAVWWKKQRSFFTNK